MHGPSPHLKLWGDRPPSPPPQVFAPGPAYTTSSVSTASKGRYKLDFPRPLRIPYVITMSVFLLFKNCFWFVIRSACYRVAVWRPLFLTMNECKPTSTPWDYFRFLA